MDKNYLVTKSNKLVTCGYDLSLQEQKIILTLASMVQPEDKEFKQYEFKIKDFMDLLGIQDKHTYSEVRKITKDLKEKVFEIKEGTDIIQVAWLGGVRYKTKEGMVLLRLDEDLKPYMLGLKELYTSYKLANILSLKSKYSIRIYEILKSNLFKKTIEIEINDFKNMVGAKDKAYSVYQNIKKRVIEQAQKELYALTDIAFDFEEIKKGRKVTSIKFYIKTNESKEKTNVLKLNTKAIDEVSATVTELEEETPIKTIMNLMSSHKISDLEAKKIYDSAKGDFDIINKVYEDIKNKPAKNFIALMISLVKPNAYIEPKKNVAKQTSIFHNFEQRTYDYDKLEQELIWNK